MRAGISATGAGRLFQEIVVGAGRQEAAPEIGLFALIAAWVAPLIAAAAAFPAARMFLPTPAGAESAISHLSIIRISFFHLLLLA
jgi:hypothetical protein